ncbi:stalk domain-containing protein [Paenibacillus cisolokensis]|uniref:stalk domain-containing protein n=1 Tax=Paenibacillus cisolokensis TaxID=1658519 RepID=UPI003D280BBE
MNFRRFTMITVLAAAQVMSTVPVVAESQDWTTTTVSSSNTVPSSLEEDPSSLTGESGLADGVSADMESPASEGFTAVDGAEVVSHDGDLSGGETDEASVSHSDATEQESITSEPSEGEPATESGQTEGTAANSQAVATSSASGLAAASAPNSLVLLMNSDVMYHNGEKFTAGQPMAVKNGVSYVAIRAMVERAGLTLRYDNQTKETIILKNGNELRFTNGSSNYKVNGETRAMRGTAYMSNNVFMVPLTAITQALGIPYSVDQPGKRVILDLARMESGSGQPGGGTANPGTGTPNIPGVGPHDLVLYMNSARMVQSGREYTAGQTMAVTNGVSYVAIRALVDRVGLRLTYDNTTKETIITRGNDVLRFKTNSNVYIVNGQQRTMKGAAYQSNNVFMVPLTSITQALDIPYRVDQPNKRVILNVSTKPIASFTVQPGEIFAGQTRVRYSTSAHSPVGLDIVDERWEGRQDLFHEPGLHTVSYSVQDSSGQWSDPYYVNIEVKAPNTPPVAMFMTDKNEYKIGEKITYINQSYDRDPGDEITYRWENNEPAFFTAGRHTVTLVVTDSHGATSSYQKVIQVSSEVMYTRDEFNHLFTEIGDKFTFNGLQVPSMDLVPITRRSEPALLIRSNSPETVYREGIVYREVGVGNTRFMIHHLNATGKRMKMYVVATNINNTPARITTQYTGMGGPIDIPTATGRASVQRYLESMQSADSFKTISLAPGESRVILDDLSRQSLANGHVVSMFADLYTDSPIRYDVIMIDEAKDPIQKLPHLILQPVDGVHNRGTYADATRIIETYERVGDTPARIAIGDRVNDPNLEGFDGITGVPQSNSGNFGVLYKIKLHRVAPNTLITLNPRGGRYMGAVMVNGNIINVPNSGAVAAPHEATVLYRTGDYERSVEILFTAAPGSSLPVNLLLQPLPESK